MIKIENLKKSYKKQTALSIPELTINDGEILGLVGNNGAGKTTFLRSILDLIQLDSGSVTIHGILNTSTDAWKKYTASYLGVSFLIPFLSVEEYFEFVSKLYGINTEGVSESYERFNKFFSDEILAQKKIIADFSQGNKNKIGIAAALMPKSKILLLDEPYSNLDPRSQNSLSNLIKDLKTDGNTTVILSSHDLNHITNICDRVVILEKGTIKKDMNRSDGFDELTTYFNN